MCERRIHMTWRLFCELSNKINNNKDTINMFVDYFMSINIVNIDQAYSIQVLNTIYKKWVKHHLNISVVY